MSVAFLCAGIRTPIGRYGGVLANVRPDDLAARAIEALVAQLPDLNTSCIDEVILGCANQAGEDNRNVARMAALLGGLPTSVPGVTVNRLCASGLEAVGQAARAINAGYADVIIAGGVESMSRAPFVMGKANASFSRDIKLEDTTIGWRFVNPAMVAAYGIHPMPETAEEVATQFSIARLDQDKFALASQEKAARAIASGRFDREITPVSIAIKGGEKIVSQDEHPRLTSLDALSALKPIVRKDGTVTAGNASGVNDGAAVILVASEAGIKAHGLTPIARIVGMASAGVEPRIMGIGPVPATQKLLKRAGLSVSDLDVIELNEAFAAQGLAVLRGLNIEDEDPRVNPNGGGIALGHPLGMSGTRLVLTCAHELFKNGGKRGLVTLCVGVGQGLSLLLERV